MDTTSLDRQLSDFVIVTALGLRSGYSLRQLMETMSGRAPEPTASVCRGWVAGLEAGCTYDECDINRSVATWQTSSIHSLGRSTRRSAPMKPSIPRCATWQTLSRHHCRIGYGKSSCRQC